MKTINRLKKITKNKSITEERKNLVQVCNSVANLAEGIPLAGNGNISHSDQDKALQHFSLSLKCELPIPEVTRLRTLSCGKPKFNESEQLLIRRYAPYKSSHSDQDKALQHFSLSLKCEVSYSGSDAIADNELRKNQSSTSPNNR